MTARIHTAVRNVHHSSRRRFQNSPLHRGNNPNLAGDGTDVLSRIMGLILAALSVENIVAGIRGLISAGLQIQV